MSRSKSMTGLCAAALMIPLAVEALANGKDPLPRADPATVGMSAERLGRIGTALKAEVEKGRLPGAVVAVARRGKLVYYEAVGALDPTTKAPMQIDAIFSIASMTKPMVSVGIMMLHEEGKLSIADPIGKYLPQMANMQVADVKTDASGAVTVESKPAKRQPTIHDPFAPHIGHHLRRTRQHACTQALARRFCFRGDVLHERRVSGEDRQAAAALRARYRLGLQPFGRCARAHH